MELPQFAVPKHMKIPAFAVHFLKFENCTVPDYFKSCAWFFDFLHMNPGIACQKRNIPGVTRFQTRP